MSAVGDCCNSKATQLALASSCEVVVVMLVRVRVISAASSLVGVVVKLWLALRKWAF